MILLAGIAEESPLALVTEDLGRDVAPAERGGELDAVEDEDAAGVVDADVPGVQITVAVTDSTTDPSRMRPSRPRARRSATSALPSVTWSDSQRS